MSVAKQEVEALLKKLPDECTLEDIQYHRYVIEKSSGTRSARLAMVNCHGRRR